MINEFQILMVGIIGIILSNLSFAIGLYLELINIKKDICKLIEVKR